MKNQHIFKVTRPSDKLHKPFYSSWIDGDTKQEAHKILARTYKAKDGFVLIWVRDLISGDAGLPPLVP